MRQQARNQRHALQQWPVRVGSVLAQLIGVTADLDQRLASLEKQIAEVLVDDAWASSAALLSTIPWIGLITNAWLLVSTLNFSLCAMPEQAAAYAGLVLLQWESGTSVRSWGTEETGTCVQRCTWRACRRHATTR